MDHLPRSGSRHHPPPAGKQPPTLLTRCKSENPATSPPFTAISSNKPYTFTKSRSISTTNNTILTSPAAKKKAAQDTGSKILPRKKPTSPSAWALSPGRVAPCPSPLPLQPPTPGVRSRTSAISGVLKYFRPKKTLSEVPDVHCFKLLNNRLLQWRFANARAETTMSTVQAAAEKKVFNAWLEILAIRNSNMVKRMEVQKLKHHMKLYHIMNSQMFLLEKWSRIEAKNFEAVGRVVRKLSLASVNVPMLHDSKVKLTGQVVFKGLKQKLSEAGFERYGPQILFLKGDVSAVCDVLDNATTLLEDIESMITKLSYQAEKSCYLLTELSIIAKQEHESLVELQTWMTTVALLKEEERSLRTHLMQQTM